MRPSDADRENVTTTLRDACADGRLSADELEQRLDVAWRATDTGELAALVADIHTLPARRPAGGFGGGQIAAAALITVLVPLGRLVALVTALALLRGETDPVRRSQLRLWAGAAAGLLVVEAVLIAVLVL